MQTTLFHLEPYTERYSVIQPDIDYGDYDHVIVAFSGGKDSLASVLHLLEDGCPPEKIELWHHEIDGRGERLMDWPVTPAYCRAVAQHLGLRYYVSWKVGGFLGELMKTSARTAAIRFEEPTETGLVLRKRGGTDGKVTTRRMFPAVSADLTKRWCSSYLKIMVGEMALRNQARFRGKRTLFVTGERAEESTNRAKYKPFHPHKESIQSRQIDHWRPVLGWPERDVWSIIERWSINPHPAYRLGWGRVSCLHCIFGSANQCASAAVVDPEGTERLTALEIELDHTIRHKQPLPVMVAKGRPYPMDEATIAEAMATSWSGPVRVDEWTLPAGAYGESCGPV